jgi:NAD(P)-dependent dehydrogenase (short-subunit alcohol dehydrogenase family)
VALVTGGGGGIGGAIATALAGDGHAVAVADLRLESARETARRVVAAGGRAAPFQVDVTDGGTVAEAVAA